jgi:hypothetical protein
MGAILNSDATLIWFSIFFFGYSSFMFQLKICKKSDSFIQTNMITEGPKFRQFRSTMGHQNELETQIWFQERDAISIEQEALKKAEDTGESSRRWNSFKLLGRAWDTEVVLKDARILIKSFLNKRRNAPYTLHAKMWERVTLLVLWHLGSFLSVIWDQEKNAHDYIHTGAAPIRLSELSNWIRLIWLRMSKYHSSTF